VGTIVTENLLHTASFREYLKPCYSITWKISIQLYINFTTN